ncbi:hypothetical protein VB712_13780 [Spirulina sp. CCNP1310]|uniref:hypothetical protein n=1 Tax=Spirulina sp. CCNP1310 TaxID=3110249 RepID=UPI002B208FBE|nr:hypothetical protein [Spirulina sp. CCNP1310]MEA5420296.1 hypothetical protein [Spirulina sp. CCNP1310]
MRDLAAPLLCSLLVMAIAPLPAHSEEIPIPVLPAETESIPVETTEFSLDALPTQNLNPETTSTLIKIFSEGLQQTIRGEEFTLSPAVTGMITETMLTEFENIAAQGNAPSGVMAFVRAMRLATQGAPNDQVTESIKGAFQAILDSF